MKQSVNPPAILLSQKHSFQIKEACLFSGLCRSTIYKLASAGKLRMVRIGGRRLILREDLERLLNRGAEFDPTVHKQAAPLTSPNAA
jgi:excisionase family DNA binding protein